MKRLFATCALVAVMAMSAGTAAADWGVSFGYNQGYGGYSYAPQSYWYPQPHYHWHDTSHWDYHGPQYVPHGNHYHYVPGHYHWHNQGHWDPHW